MEFDLPDHPMTWDPDSIEPPDLPPLEGWAKPREVSAIDLVWTPPWLQIQQGMLVPLRSWTMNVQCSKHMLSGQRLHQSVVHMVK